TLSANFPTTARAFQKDKPRPATDTPNVFVAKLDSKLTQVIYATYLGGTKGVSVVIGTGPAEESRYGDNAYAIAVDKSGAAYVVGRTDAANFPGVNAVQKAHAPVPVHHDRDTPYGQND